ncbi:hypothetical protein GCM10011316_10720 [Roseibium aquae]|uniref:von Hippel-Lindau disease tumour suppressor beta domain-containing protein n=1 Tax=Roseibium aquae TaxID=1323746 RepID=A0A916TFH5_9HYPH|nr:hypothetical protein [Roseibium aquae]GGB40531.1 hypothetical protein GCM10011316_10720 [Roseibium aquae]
MGRKRSGLLATGPTGRQALAPLLLGGLLAATPGLAQTPPETLRINVEPPSPGIRSILIDKRFRPIINRDSEGVIIDTIGNNGTLPPCEVELEVTLENSRVLHRGANLCTGGTLVVDVETDGKPGRARVVGGSTGIQPGPVGGQADPPTSTRSPAASEPAQDGLDPLSPAGGLEPLDSAEIPQTSVDAGAPETSAPPERDLSAIVQDSLARQGAPAGNTGAITIGPSDDRVWSAETGNGPGTISTLIHTVPGTEDADFRASCSTQAGQAVVRLVQTHPGIQEGVGHPVRLSAGDFNQTYTAMPSSANNRFGLSFPELTLDLADPLWQALIRHNELTVAIQGMTPYAVSLSGSASPVRLFVAGCSAPQQIIGETDFSDGEFGVASIGTGDVPCSEAGRIRSMDGVRPGQIVFRNSSPMPIDVNWIDYNGGERAYARLQPGQILEQQTFVSHAWMVRGTSGQCQGIYVSSTPYREVVITGITGSPQGGGTGLGQPLEPLAPFPSGPVPPADIGTAAPILQTGPGSGQVADYLCTAGIDLNVVFSADGQTATVAEMGYRAILLNRQPAASGFHFEAQGHVLRGQINNATWARPGLRDVFCSRR